MIDLEHPLLAFSIWDARIWWAIPLLVAISFVYGATRHEYVHEIVAIAIRSMVWIAMFVGFTVSVIWLFGWWN